MVRRIFTSRWWRTYPSTSRYCCYRASSPSFRSASLININKYYFKESGGIRRMSKLLITGQKLIGKLQQAKGEVEVSLGEPLKGNVDKLRGKANEIEANIKGKIQNSDY